MKIKTTAAMLMTVLAVVNVGTVGAQDRRVTRVHSMFFDHVPVFADLKNMTLATWSKRTSTRAISKSGRC